MAVRGHPEHGAVDGVKVMTTVDLWGVAQLSAFRQEHQDGSERCDPLYGSRPRE